MAVVTHISDQACCALMSRDVSFEFGYGDAYHFSTKIPQTTSVDIAEMFTLTSPSRVAVSFVVVDGWLKLESEVVRCGGCNTIIETQLQCMICTCPVCNACRGHAEALTEEYPACKMHSSRVVISFGTLE